MGREEQQEEIEVLESIFPDELTKTEDDQIRIAIKLDLPDDVIEATKSAAANNGDDDDDDDDADDNSAPVIILSVKYPEDYPDKAPHLDLAPPPQQHQQKHPLFSVADDKDALLAGLADTIEENLGMAMVFTIVSALKDAAEQLIISRHEAIVKAQEEAALAAEREESKRFHGSAVTPESFVKWQTAFLKEMAEQRQRDLDAAAAELAKKVRGGGGPGGLVGKDGVRLTGRQIWEQGLAGKVDEDADEEEVAVDVQKLKIEA